MKPNEVKVSSRIVTGLYCLTDVTQLPINIEYQMDGPRMHENAFELMTLTEDLPFQ